MSYLEYNSTCDVLLLLCIKVETFHCCYYNTDYFGQVSKQKSGANQQFTRFSQSKSCITFKFTKCWRKRQRMFLVNNDDADLDMCGP